MKAMAKITYIKKQKSRTRFSISSPLSVLLSLSSLSQSLPLSFTLPPPLSFSLPFSVSVFNICFQNELEIFHLTVGFINIRQSTLGSHWLILFNQNGVDRLSVYSLIWFSSLAMLPLSDIQPRFFFFFFFTWSFKINVVQPLGCGFSLELAKKINRITPFIQHSSSTVFILPKYVLFTGLYFYS